jgi:hypothetical protein
MLLAASQDRSGGEWLTCASLEVETLLVGGGGWGKVVGWSGLAGGLVVGEGAL